MVFEHVPLRFLLLLVLGVRVNHFFKSSLHFFSFGVGGFFAEEEEDWTALRCCLLTLSKSWDNTFTSPSAVDDRCSGSAYLFAGDDFHTTSFSLLEFWLRLRFPDFLFKYSWLLKFFRFSIEFSFWDMFCLDTRPPFWIFEFQILCVGGDTV